MATANLPQGADIIGAAVPRIDGPLKTTGSGALRGRSPFSRISRTRSRCRAPSAKAASAALDASAAEKMPGVLLVMHHGNMEGAYRTFLTRRTAPPAKRGRPLKTTRSITGASTSR